MAVINDPNTAANIALVAPLSTLNANNYALSTFNRPIPHGNLGHYRCVARFTLAATQAAASRVWEIRNTNASNLLVITRLVIRTVQSAAGTAQSNGLDIFRNTSFSAVDTTNTVTPTVIPKRSGFAAAPGAAAVRHVTVAGAAAGMTGGTRTPDASPFSAIPIVITATAAAAVNTFDIMDDVNSTHPFVFVQNEGIEIQNRVLNVTSYGVDVYVDCTWAEVTAY
jgi:hypothetical protein